MAGTWSAALPLGQFLAAQLASDQTRSPAVDGWHPTVCAAPQLERASSARAIEPTRRQQGALHRAATRVTPTIQAEAFLLHTLAPQW